MEDPPQLAAESGIAYYMSPPHTFNEVVLDPIHTISAGALFSKTWIEVSGFGPRNIAFEGSTNGKYSFGASFYRDLTIFYRSRLAIARH